MTFLFSEQVKKIPIFIEEDPLEPFYVLPGENLTVTARVLRFGTDHFELLKHIYNNQSNVNVTKSFKVLNIHREDVPVFREEMNGGAREYSINYYFNNITEADLGFYSIMAGDTRGFSHYNFQIDWQKPGLWHSFKITPQFRSFRDINILIEIYAYNVQCFNVLIYTY